MKVISTERNQIWILGYALTYKEGTAEESEFQDRETSLEMSVSDENKV